MDYSKLPALNASLNATSAVFLLLGYIFIRQRAIKAHTICMVTASFTTLLFLISYITYHMQHHLTRFQGTGAVRVLYFAVLISHTILAVVNLPMVIVTLWRGLSGNFTKHAAIARITFPIWMYVSVTGVLVYLMLYHMKP